MDVHTPSPLERDALALLTHAIAPSIRRPEDRPVARAIRTAADRGDLRALRSLSERQRRELLTLLELRSGTTWGPDAARAVVLLTTTLAGAPALVRGRRLGTPAR